ncbi:MAG: dienelactone hydrolase family protein, partial [Acidobacteriota bacterium]|nr:dienelactone hydrolase family protein [Acidobacteriota bacterium]
MLILMHGGGSPEGNLYRDQTSFHPHNGFEVLVLHYLDATQGKAVPSGSSYRMWSRVLLDLIAREKRREQVMSIGVVGYSLGASVALAAASQTAPIDAIAEWYGSMPDSFVERKSVLPPL